MLIWANIAVFAVQIIVGFFARGLVENILGMSMDGLRSWFLWQPVSYMFLHSTRDLFHIIFNLLVLWFFGREVEYFIGPRAFTRLYFTAGLAGGALWLACNFHTVGLLIGASAAVLGCVIAFATLFPNREITLLIFFVIPVRMKAKYLALGVIALDVIPVLSQAQTGIAHLAHLGGAAIGYLYIKHLGYGSTPRWLQAAQSVTETVSAPLRRTVTRPTRPASKPLSREEFMRQKVDPILDKINREGMQSLTEEERAILEKASSVMDKNKS
jgi:membrane associated rhomboid family serine protease